MAQQIYLYDKEELEQLIKKAVKQAFEQFMPQAIRQASRKKWLNSNELMELLNCSRRHLQYLRDSKQIPYVQNAKTIRYDMDDVEDFLSKHKVPSRKK
ncbi:MAG: helix-turn-helix domain-containing protein [Candidatus Paceibacterota bacterium]